MKINFANHDFILDPSGALFWLEESLLVVSDLHLEKGSHFALREFFLPPYDSQETLEKLHAVIQKLSPDKILLLGDCFHDSKGYNRLNRKARTLFDALLAYQPIWIKGNHDGEFVPSGFVAYETYLLKNIAFSHAASDVTTPEISGHYHPKVNITHKETTITRPCFIEDGVKFILPAFGTYAGGLSITNPAINSLFKEGANIYALGQDKIYEIRTLAHDAVRNRDLKHK